MEPALKYLLETVGLPVVTALGAIYFYAKHLAPKANGRDLTTLTQHLDLKLTQHFDQLRRDLETKIENTVESKLTAYFLQLDLDRSRERGKR